MKSINSLVTEDILCELPTPHKKAVYATIHNTESVRKGFEMGGYEKEPSLYTEEQMTEYALKCVKSFLRNYVD